MSVGKRLKNSPGMRAGVQPGWSPGRQAGGQLPWIPGKLILEDGRMIGLRPPQSLEFGFPEPH